MIARMSPDLLAVAMNEPLIMSGRETCISFGGIIDGDHVPSHNRCYWLARRYERGSKVGTHST